MKKNIGKQLSGLTVSTGVFLLGLGSSTVYAEEKAGATDTEESNIDTISVTASRIERATKEVPAAIVVIGEERIDSEKNVQYQGCHERHPRRSD